MEAISDTHGGPPLSDSTPGSDPRLAQVLFKGRRSELFLIPESIPLVRGDPVIVEVERGCDLGEVRFPEAPALRPRKDQVPRRILRRATAEEMVLWRELRGEDETALRTVKDRVGHFGLPMHMVDAEYQFDRNRVTFYFTADHRIDFRELVRDLAGIFRTRIELRQINAREAARRLGGCGPCGRSLCCAVFLADFERVTLQTARSQRASANPSRLSGLCGRLMCCLTYEGGEGGCGACSRREEGCELPGPEA